MATPTRIQPTEKQVAFIRTLLAERTGADADPTVAAAAEAVRDGLNAARTSGRFTKAVASSAIEVLLAIKVGRKPEGLPTTPDPHRHAALHATHVPAGHYAVASRTGTNDLDFWTVDVPTEGKWAGYTFVSRVIGGREDQRVRGAEQRAALAAIEAAGPEAAAVLYGQQVGRCYRCNRHLTDETSRQLGIGPDCRTKG